MVIYDQLERDNKLSEPMKQNFELKTHVEVRAGQQMITTWDHIEKDVERTRKEMNFFSKSCGRKFSAELVSLTKSKAKISERAKNEDYENHRDVLTRILFVFARTNVAVGYAQGMNEIAAVLYYCFHELGFVEDREHVEADTFWCFFRLVLAVGQVEQFKDNFLFGMNTKDHPMRVSLNHYEKLLANIHPRTAAKFKELGVQSDFYAYRWFLLFFTQEFDILDLMRLWDALLCFFHADHKLKFDAFLTSLSLSIIGLIEEDLLKGDLNACMMLLQRHRTSIHLVLDGAEKLVRRLRGVSVEEIFEKTED